MSDFGQAWDELKQQRAVEIAKEAFGIEDTYLNRYRCDDCDVDWDDEWSCACDDECPECGIAYSPYDSEVVDEDEEPT